MSDLDFEAEVMGMDEAALRIRPNHDLDAVDVLIRCRGAVVTFVMGAPQARVLAQQLTRATAALDARRDPEGPL